MDRNPVPSKKYKEINSSEINVYPNPARVNTTVQTKEKGLYIKQVVVYNILGNQVLQKNGNSTNKVSFNVEGLKNGQYIVWVLLSNQNSQTTTLIKV